MNQGFYGFPPRQDRGYYEVLDPYSLSERQRHRCLYDLDFSKPGWLAKYGALASVNWTGFATEDVDTTVPGALFVDHAGSGAVLHRVKLLPLPTGDFDAVLTASGFADGGFQSGIYVTDGTTAGAGNQNLIYSGQEAATQGWFAGARYTNFTTFAASILTARPFFAPVTILRVRKSGASWFASISADGRLWCREEPFTPTGVIAHIGFGGNTPTAATYRSAWAFHSFRIFQPSIHEQSVGQVRRYREVAV